MAVIETFRHAYSGAFQPVYGPPNPSGRRGVPPSLKTRPNPKGDGVIVTPWKNHNREGMADYSRERLVWLVFDGTVYPLQIEAASALGRLYDGVPEDIQKRVGLKVGYGRGETMLDQLGIEERTSVRRFEGGGATRSRSAESLRSVFGPRTDKSHLAARRWNGAPALERDSTGQR